MKHHDEEKRSLELLTTFAPAGFLLLLANVVLLGLAGSSGFFAWVRVTYAFNTVIVPILLGVAACVALVRWLRRRHRHIAVRAAVWSAAAVFLFGLRVWATHIEPTWLQVREVELRSEKLVQPLRIVHFTDTQSAKVSAYEARVFKQIRDLEPDLVLFTGDLIQPVAPATLAGELAAMERLLETVDPPLGFYGVYGDTDGHLLAREGRSKSGNLVWLRNEGVTVKHGEDAIRLFGLGRGEAHDSSGQLPRRLAGWLESGEGRALEIVMGHGPNYTLAARQHDIDLSLAGHTHGGQIRLPLFGPMITLSDVPRAWARGFRREGRTWINVSAGIGAEHAAGVPSIRLNCPPEMTLITIRPAER